ncbi:hypothetical protein DPMN_116521 [Dreissena polymorpha]|uniref:Uncharacterized protein n=1 Tax=Dreissena polymorpha TaxID=45954 RepID=A0A9D4QUT8_DREPO|nr:hypothetical protein DPMN_116521 [Dreissena polymorpha]
MTEMELITVALEDLLNNYDKRIRPGYGGMYLRYGSLKHGIQGYVTRDTSV